MTLVKRHLCKAIYCIKSLLASRFTGMFDGGIRDGVRDAP